MAKHVAEDNDRLRDLKEWQEHRYDPGYFTGGRIHPVVRGPRPNKYGYILLVWGLVLILVLFLEPDHVLYWYYAALQTGFALLLITAGLKLIRKPRSREPRTRKNRPE